MTVKYHTYISVKGDLGIIFHKVRNADYLSIYSLKVGDIFNIKGLGVLKISKFTSDNYHYMSVENRELFISTERVWHNYII